MPRIARPHTPSILESQAIVRRYLSSPDASQASLARLAGVAPYTVNRLLSGRIKDVTAEVQKIMSVAISGNNAPASMLGSNAQLERAVASLWDGTDEGLQRLVGALEAAGPLLKMLTMPATRASTSPATGARSSDRLVRRPRRSG